MKCNQPSVRNWICVAESISFDDNLYFMNTSIHDLKVRWMKSSVGCVYLTAPPLGQDVTQGQFLSRV